MKPNLKIKNIHSNYSSIDAGRRILNQSVDVNHLNQNKLTHDDELHDEVQYNQMLEENEIIDRVDMNRRQSKTPFEEPNIF